MNNSEATIKFEEAGLFLKFRARGLLVATILFTQTVFGLEPPVADHHLHIRTMAAAELLAGKGGERPAESLQSQTAAEALEAMDAASIEKGLVLSLAYLFGSTEVTKENEYEWVQAENNYVAEQVATAPDRLVGACSISPMADYAIAEIDRCHTELELPVFKLHLANSGVDLRNPEHVAVLQTVFGRLAELDIPAVVHLRTGEANYGEPDATIFIDSVLTKVPELPIQIAHMGGWGGYDAATDSAMGAFEKALKDGRLKNPIWFDLGAVVFHPAAAGDNKELADQVREANQMLADRIRGIGIDRVVFATDWPSWPPIPDSSQKLAVNHSLIEEVLPLEPAELAVIYQNMVPWLGL